MNTDRLELLEKRHSVRSFSPEPLPKETVNKLKAEITMTNTHEQGFRFQFFTDDPDPMRGMSKSYGTFRNPRNYLAAVVDVATPDAYERAGYFAEKFVIRATELGLGTCIVGSTFNSNEVKAQMRAGEKLLFLVLVGYPGEKETIGGRIMSKVTHLRRRDGKRLFIPENRYEEALGECRVLKIGMEAISCAPSALNRQPVRVRMLEAGGNKVPCAEVPGGNDRNLIDLGIAKFNFNYATETECEWGNGSPLMRD